MKAKILKVKMSANKRIYRTIEVLDETKLYNLGSTIIKS